jgi:succinate-acetate transporter protein
MVLVGALWAVFCLGLVVLVAVRVRDGESATDIAVGVLLLIGVLVFGATRVVGVVPESEVTDAVLLGVIVLYAMLAVTRWQGEREGS